MSLSISLSHSHSISLYPPPEPPGAPPENITQNNEQARRQNWTITAAELPVSGRAVPPSALPPEVARRLATRPARGRAASRPSEAAALAADGRARGVAVVRLGHRRPARPDARNKMAVAKRGALDRPANSRHAVPCASRVTWHVQGSSFSGVEPRTCNSMRDCPLCAGCICRTHARAAEAALQALASTPRGVARSSSDAAIQ